MLPVVVPALAFTAGCVLLQRQPQLPDWPWPALLGGVVLLFAAMLRGGRCRAGLAALLALLAGIVWAGWRAEMRLADRLDPALEGVDLRVTGVVASLPDRSDRGERFEFRLETRLTVDGEALPARAAGLPSRVLLTHYRRLPAEGSEGGEGREAPGGSALQFHAGERWRLTIRLKQAHGLANPGGFDYEAWLLERGLRAGGYLRPEGAERLTAFVPQPGLIIERVRERIRERLQSRLPPDQFPAGGILIALGIGDQRAIPPADWQIFSRTGTTHLMSISGLHVTLLAALAGGGLGFVWRRLPWLAVRWPAQRAGLATAGVAGLGYALLAGFSVPAQRTAFMLLVAVAAALGQRQPAPSRVLALALWGVLLLDPWAVLAPGFWLSFGAVGALFWIGHAAPGGDWRARLLGWGRVQWAATLASLPVLLLVFQQLPLVSPLANALAIPLVSGVITPLALFAAFFSDWTPGAWALQIAHALLALLLEGLAWCAAWPLWQPPAPPWPVALLAALGVLIVLLPRGLPGRGLGACLILPVLYWPAERPPAGEAWIDVLDVGQGLAVVIRSATQVVVYDTGPRYGPAADAGERVLLPFLRRIGVGRIDRLILSHRDSDHAGGAASLQAALPVGELRSSFAGEPAGRCRAGERWQQDGVAFSFLHPAAATVDRNHGLKSNHLSCVLRVEAGGRALLLAGDIEAADEADLLASVRESLVADVLVVPHHGSRTSSTPAFVAAVAPLHAIFTVGYRNRFGHPRAEVAARYAAHGARLWRSDRDGAIQVRLGREGARVRAWRAQSPRYWSSGAG